MPYHGRNWSITVFFQPGKSIRTGGLASKAFLIGIFICRFHQLTCYAPPFQRLGHKGMYNHKGSITDNIIHESCMTFDLSFETVFVYQMIDLHKLFLRCGLQNKCQPIYFFKAS